jgi:hypothetical protein
MNSPKIFAALLILAALCPAVRAAEEPSLPAAAQAASDALAASRKPVILSEAAIKPNNSFDGPLYRALTGANVLTDGEGTRRVESGGRLLLECRLGHGRGPAYNDYDCTIFFARAFGPAAAAVYDALDADKSVLLQVENGGECRYMHCQTLTSLKCSSRELCGIVTEVSGWNE